MDSYFIEHAIIVNENKLKKGNVLISGKHIKSIYYGDTQYDDLPAGTHIINAEGKFLLPGVIDCHVHFREPGLTHKATIASETRAAVAGGVTSIMEMPNTKPPATTNKLVEEKCRIAERKAMCNYAFFIGAANNNLPELIKADPKKIPGIKLFMGSSTGDMLVDDVGVLEKIFNSSSLRIVAHCEDENIIKKNNELFYNQLGEKAPASVHEKIRNENACLQATNKAIALAKRFNKRLHIAHITTAKEAELLDNSLALKEKLITGEVSIHHLWYSHNDYEQQENKIKCNPSIKSARDQQALLKALKENYIDIIATDHAPHTLDEKQQPYFKAPSGIPMIQHALVSMLEFCHQKKLTITEVVQKMAHNPAILFNIEKRGFIREGFMADLVLVDMNSTWQVTKDNTIYKCKWSPFENTTFHSRITHTFVNGYPAFINGKINTDNKGEQLLFTIEGDSK